jgi:hypothetical protein
MMAKPSKAELKSMNEKLAAVEKRAVMAETLLAAADKRALVAEERAFMLEEKLLAMQVRYSLP